MKWKKLAAVVLLTAILSGCGTAPAEQPNYAPPEEDRLTIYTSHKEAVYLPIVREFEERTGIWVDVVTGGTNELLEKIEQEADAPKADVLFGGGVESIDACRDAFLPYVCSDAGKIPDKYLSSGSYWTPFSALPVVLIYNTKLVSPAQLTSWADLWSPAFRGRIAFADPSVSGSSFTALVTLLYASELAQEDAMARFADVLDGQMLEGSGDVLTAVANGTCLVGITLEETAMKYVAAGEDIAIVYPADGTSCVPDGCAIIKGAAHPENARAFLDFTVSYDVQRLLSGEFNRRSIRTDIPAGLGIPPLQNITLVDYDIEWVCENREDILRQWAAYTQEVAP